MHRVTRADLLKLLIVTLPEVMIEGTHLELKPVQFFLLRYRTNKPQSKDNDGECMYTNKGTTNRKSRGSQSDMSLITFWKHKPQRIGLGIDRGREGVGLTQSQHTAEVVPEQVTGSAFLRTQSPVVED